MFVNVKCVEDHGVIYIGEILVTQTYKAMIN